MKREILFRGKAVNLHNGSKDFVYGQYVQNRDGKMIYSDTWEDGIQKHYVIEKTVGQYTGLTDKNGTKIFEGDILESHWDDLYPEDVSYEVVLWKYNGWCIKEVNHDDVDILDVEESMLEYSTVVGNIYDNPELLEVKR